MAGVVPKIIWKSQWGEEVVLPQYGAKEGQGITRVKRYLWDRFLWSTPVNCRKCKVLLLDGWKVSVNDRDDPIEVYYICHSCAKTKPRDSATCGKVGVRPPGHPESLLSTSKERCQDEPAQKQGKSS